MVTRLHLSGGGKGHEDMEVDRRSAKEQRDRGELEKKPITSHQQLEVYQMAFEAAMTIFRLSKSFPTEERYSLTDQILTPPLPCPRLP